jgi:uncharacterized protein YbaR (Trm112 family)/SAM-dependent methyltransferase
MLDLLGCPTCLARQPLKREDGVLTCPACRRAYPVLGGVPILVPEPESWCASHRDAAVAALVDADRLTPEDMACLDRFAAQDRRAPRGVPFSDDWVASEGNASPPPSLEAGGHPWLTELADLLARLPDPDAWLAARAQGRVLEVGSGDAALTRRMLGRGLEVVAGDRSLSAALRATAAGATGVVLDATRLPAWPGGRPLFGTVVAAHLVDLLDLPEAFLEGASELLEPGGRILLSTPDPALGGAEGTPALQELLAVAGYDEEEAVEAHPWARRHDRRHLELYAVTLVAARFSPGRGGPRR